MSPLTPVGQHILTMLVAKYGRDAIHDEATRIGRIQDAVLTLC